MISIQRRQSSLRTHSLAGLFLALYMAQHMFFLRLTAKNSKPALSYLPAADQHLQQHQQQISINLDVEFDYLQSIKDTRRELIFVHIPKTAGTMIESVGGLHATPKVVWGSCLFNHKPKRRGGVCRYPQGQFEWPTKIGWWHLPSHLFPLMGINPYEGAELFGVVRDPLDRLLSEFYYVCRKKKNNNWEQIDCDQTLIHDSGYLNEWVQSKLARTLSNRSSANTLLFDNSHYTPQYDFAVARGGVRTLDYVLQMNSIKSEFQKLMKAYGIKAVMPENKVNAARNDTRDLQVKDMDSSTLALAHQAYKHDFDLLPMEHKPTEENSMHNTQQSLRQK